MKKQMLRFFFTALLCIGWVTFAVPTEAKAETVQVKASLLQDGEFPEPVNVYAAGISQYLSDGSGTIPSYNAGGVEQTIHDGIWNAQPSIDISSYQVSSAQTTVQALVEKVLNNSPDLFFVNNSFTYRASGSYVSTLEFTYKASGATLDQQKTFYTAKLNELVNKVNPRWTDEQKVLFVNDYLAQNYEYDKSLVIHDAYNFFYQKKGVCQSYTLVFEAVMQKLGIEVSWATSTAMNHIWNVVKVGGNWYHVDVTWNDPTDDLFGRACHTNLLLSNSGITSTGHHDWSPSYTTGSKYDNYFWKNSTSPFQYINGKWYYAMYDSSARTTYLYERNFSTNNSTRLLDIGPYYVYNNTSSFYQAAFTGLGVGGNELYYNTYNSIYKYNPSTGTKTLVLTPSVSGYIYGMRIEGNKLKYYYAGSNYQTGTVATYTLPGVSSNNGTFPHTFADYSGRNAAQWLFLVSASGTIILFIYKRKYFIPVKNSKGTFKN